MGAGGISHWIIILVIVLVLFGAGRVSGLMGELGKGMKSFKDGLNEGDQQKQNPPPPPQQLPPQSSQPIDITPRAQEPVTPPPAGDDQPR